MSSLSVTNDKLSKTISQNEEIIKLLKIQIMLASDGTPLNSLLSQMETIEKNEQRNINIKLEERRRQEEIRRQNLLEAENRRREEKEEEKIKSDLEERKRVLEKKDKEILDVISSNNQL